MEQVNTARHLRAQVAANQVPAPQDPVEPERPRRRRRSTRTSRCWATLDSDEFKRLMVAITEWVSPGAGLQPTATPTARTQLRQGLHQGRGAADAADDAQHQRRLERPRRADRRHLLHLPSRPAGAGRRSGSPIPGRRRPGHGRQQGRAEHRRAGGRACRRCPTIRSRRSCCGDQNIRVHLDHGACREGNETSIKQAEWTYGADDAHVRGSRRQLHLLPQHALVLRLGPEQPGAQQGLARHPHGARPEQRLPRAAQPTFPPTGSARSAMRRRSTARPATMAPTSRFWAPACSRTIRNLARSTRQPRSDDTGGNGRGGSIVAPAGLAAQASGAHGDAASAGGALRFHRDDAEGQGEPRWLRPVPA